MNLAFMKWWFPARLRPVLLRAFGATIGRNVFIRHRVRILWPWKLAIGEDSWIGEDVWLLNLEPIHIGSNVCLSQRVSIISGSHDRRSPSFEYDNAPICIGNGAWLAFGSTVLRGVSVGVDATVGACKLVRRDVAPGEFLTS
jgi:putative colanic acid biosynthesis acetyltransferase WcaF